MRDILRQLALNLLFTPDERRLFRMGLNRCVAYKQQYPWATEYKGAEALREDLLRSTRKPFRIIHETSTGYRYPHGAMIYVGRWACRISLRRSGRFGNGSRFFSGWSDWTKDTTP